MHTINRLNPQPIYFRPEQIYRAGELPPMLWRTRQLSWRSKRLFTLLLFEEPDFSNSALVFDSYPSYQPHLADELRIRDKNEGDPIKTRRKRRRLKQVQELVREFQESGLTRRKFSKNFGIALSELKRSLKIAGRG